jgi:hypothetical protein
MQEKIEALDVQFNSSQREVIRLEGQLATVFLPLSFVSFEPSVLSQFELL